MKNRIKVMMITAVLVIIAVAIYIAAPDSTVVETVETQKFYISEATELFTKKKYYIVSNEEIEAEVTNPELMEYCSQHVGETVNIKIKAIYDKTEETYTDIDYISIEEKE